MSWGHQLTGSLPPKAEMVRFNLINSRCNSCHPEPACLWPNLPASLSFPPPSSLSPSSSLLNAFLCLYISSLYPGIRGSFSMSVCVHASVLRKHAHTCCINVYIFLYMYCISYCVLVVHWFMPLQFNQSKLTVMLQNCLFHVFTFWEHQDHRTSKSSMCDPKDTSVPGQCFNLQIWCIDMSNKWTLEYTVNSVTLRWEPNSLFPFVLILSMKWTEEDIPFVH